MSDLLVKQDFERLVLQYGTILLRMTFLFLKDIHLAEDAVQETFLRVYKYRSNYREAASEKTWIYRIAINVCKDMNSRSWWKRIDYNANYEQIEDFRHEQGADDPAISIEIMKLTNKYRQVILLYYYLGFSLKEIGGILNITESAAAMRLKRARDQLKQKLKGWYE